MFYSVTRARRQVYSLFHNNGRLSYDKKNEEIIKSRETHELLFLIKQEIAEV